MVDKIQGLGDPFQIEKTKTGRSEEGKFSSIFENLLKRSQGVSETAPPLTIHQPLKIERVDQIEEKAKVAFDALLTELERYSRLLGDETRSLKEVGEALEKVEERASELARYRENLPDRLHIVSLIDEALSLVYAEGVKFRRGDYL